MRKIRIMALSAMCCCSASAATECVWIGGGGGDVFTESNWSPKHVPSSQNMSAYIAVFTNSVTLSASQTYWYPAGIIVSNNAAVVYSQNRIAPSTVCEDAAFPVRVESGSSLSFGSSVIFYGSSSLTLAKSGGGSFSVPNWCGNGNMAGGYWGLIDVKDGTLALPTKENFACVGGTLRVRSDALVRVNAGNAFGSGAEFSQPKVQIDSRGVFDANGKSFSVAALSGCGVVTNCSGTLTMNLRDSGETFAGRIVGGGTLKIVPSATLTPASATWTVGAYDSLWGVSLNRTSVDGCTYDVKFSSGIDTFYAKTAPTDAPCFDTDGIPVEIARSGNFWYVDCRRTGAAGDGKSLATAFQTLKEAMDNSALAAGDTVWVAPGEYSSSPMSATLSSVSTLCRVKVPANVRLVALGPVDDTVIVGADASSPVGDGYGMGADAVRCVVLGANATLRGFTVRGGRAYATSKSAPANDAGYGGGIYADSTAVIIGCVISNCVAVRGGGACQGNYFSCRFAANRATAGALIGAHLMQKASLYNCVLTGGLGACDWYVNQTDSLALNCTFGPNENGSVRGLGDVSEKHAKVCNSLVLAAPATGAKDEYHRCIVSPQGSAEGVSFDENCTITNLTGSTSPTVHAFAGIDRMTLKPKKASSILVGAADLATYRSLFPIEQYWLSVRDADWNRRIWDDALDIGAFAYDRGRPIPGFRLIFR